MIDRIDPDLLQALDSNGFTPLHRASYWGQVEFARLLLDRGADANAASRDSFLQIGHLKVIACLREQGADPAIRGYDGAGPHAGQTARDVAISEGRQAAASLLA
jgi:ankyrin repeat protein